MKIAVAALVFAGVLGSIGIDAVMHEAAQAQGVSLPWAVSPVVKGYNSTTRLIAGVRPGTGEVRAIVAGIEIRMSDGWKTYWRHPGDSGGVPPTFDWSGSSNVASAKVLFPVPERLADANGQSIGYKKHVVFPVAVTPVDAAKPVSLKLNLEYGICREICVPAEARLELSVPPTVASLPPDLASALERVPVAAGAGKSGPSLKSASAQLTGATPGISFDIASGGAGAVDLFVEAPGGTYLPMTVKAGPETGGVQRFRIELKGVDDIAVLKGKPLHLTIATASGGVETDWVVK